LPIYKETKGLKSHTIRKLINQIDFNSLEFEELPFKLDLTATEAFKKIHLPNSSHDATEAHEYFAFEELFSLMLSARLARAKTETFKASPVSINESALKSFTKALPFTLTDDQKKAAWQALKEMSLEKPMNRLIEGDVGSGKTIVASMLAYATALDGKQTAIMVPTGVLAQQHA
jgi:ATP-dependent DNA helicase RecG